MRKHVQTLFIDILLNGIRVNWARTINWFKSKSTYAYLFKTAYETGWAIIATLCSASPANSEDGYVPKAALHAETLHPISLELVDGMAKNNQHQDDQTQWNRAKTKNVNWEK